MPLNNYGVLKGKAVDIRLGAGQSPHYQVRIVDNTTDYRIAINIQSALWPSELEYVIIENFVHPITDIAKSFREGFTDLESKPGTGALDYIRGNLFNRKALKKLPANLPGLDNDLNEKIDRIMQRALATEDCMVYAFGERWGPENQKKDKYFGFLPGNGIHDIHMNQSNVGRFKKDDGVWQDGGLIVEFPSQKKWIAIFLKFQSQGWHTDDRTGQKLDEGVDPLEPDTFDDPQGLIRIIGALVNDKASPEVEMVTLLNTTPSPVNLAKWKLADSNKKTSLLSGVLAAGEARAFKIQKPMELSNNGGLITLLEEKGLKVDGVFYTKEQASRPGWTIVF